MNLSMYTALAGAKAQQSRLDVIANNLANLQTEGYKAQSAGFVGLLYENYEKGATDDPEMGCGARMEKTDFSFENGGMIPTGSPYDFAIGGDGFFAVYNRGNDEIYYTRNGQFHLSDQGGGQFYLAAQDGSLVLDEEMGFIPVTSGTNSEELTPGIFDFVHKEGFLAQGGNYYLPTEKNGNPIKKEDVVLHRGMLESGNVDMAVEMTRIIESQRAYQMTMKMIQTADEIEQTINNLR